MNEVFVIFYDVACEGHEQRVIDSVVSSKEKAINRTTVLGKRDDILYADFDSFKVE